MKKIAAFALTVFFVNTFSSFAHAQHIVEKGETLFKIAKTHNMKLYDLINLNRHFPDPNLIYPGDHVVTREGAKGSQIVDFARSLQGVTTYVYGGQQAPYRTDCSGWVQYVYKNFSINLPRTSREQAKVGIPIKFQEMLPGDLMFFSTRADKIITHVGIYAGDDFWISNLGKGKDVRVLSTWGSWSHKYFLGATRVI